ncbi:hypothetical protein SSS_06818 [Sarcoptes scabiei]|uniref:Uncharacterized protein n=1 Tax=Sarcoptes scabiei TaxID=52283 RepID=A0A834VCZ0_SARSC|nr:hypothetical protein SSS_06818 [Sarcoptes scabiei]
MLIFEAKVLIVNYGTVQSHINSAVYTPAEANCYGLVISNIFHSESKKKLRNPRIHQFLTVKSPKSMLIVYILCIALLTASQVRGNFWSLFQHHHHRFPHCSNISSISSIFNVFNEIFMYEAATNNFWHLDRISNEYVAVDWVARSIDFDSARFYGIIWEYPSLLINIVNVFDSSTQKFQADLLQSNEKFDLIFRIKLKQYLMMDLIVVKIDSKNYYYLVEKSSTSNQSGHFGHFENLNGIFYFKNRTYVYVDHNRVHLIASNNPNLKIVIYNRLQQCLSSNQFVYDFCPKLKTLKFTDLFPCFGLHFEIDLLNLLVFFGQGLAIIFLVVLNIVLLARIFRKTSPKDSDELIDTLRISSHVFSKMKRKDPKRKDASDRYANRRQRNRAQHRYDDEPQQSSSIGTNTIESAYSIRFLGSETDSIKKCTRQKRF